MFGNSFEQNISKPENIEEIHRRKRAVRSVFSLSFLLGNASYFKFKV